MIMLKLYLMYDKYDEQRVILMLMVKLYIMYIFEL